jgi:hypothetical protein
MKDNKIGTKETLQCTRRLTGRKVKDKKNSANKGDRDRWDEPVRTLQTYITPRGALLLFWDGCDGSSLHPNLVILVKNREDHRPKRVFSISRSLKSSVLRTHFVPSPKRRLEAHATC